MKVTKTFEIDAPTSFINNTIQSLLSPAGFKIISNAQNTLIFKRGSKIAVLYSFNVKNLDTTLTISLIESNNRTLVKLDYDIFSAGQIVTSQDHNKIDNEVNELHAGLVKLFGQLKNIQQNQSPINNSQIQVTDLQCRFCGTKNDSDAKFCASCGKPI
jgi:hypothetical protein